MRYVLSLAFGIGMIGLTGTGCWWDRNQLRDPDPKVERASEGKPEEKPVPPVLKQIVPDDVTEGNAAEKAAELERQLSAEKAATGK